MTPDPLEQLLRDADRGADIVPAGQPAAVIAGQVKGRVARRATLRRGARAGVAGVSALLLIAIAWSWRPAVSSKPTVVVAARTQELAALKAEVTFREDLVNEMLLAERTRTVRRRLQHLEARVGTVDAVASADDRELMERCAGAVIRVAEVLEQDRTRRIDAIRAYAAVIERYPETISAERAKARLEQLQKDEQL